MVDEALGHYRLQAKIGEGGMGVVYRALDTHLDRPVAIKVLHAEAVGDPERKRRFVQEAKAASALNHANIVTVYDIGHSHGVDFIAMEYVPGQTLDAAIGRTGLGLGRTLKYAIQIADALSAAHATGIVHRDLKPANVMVTENDHVKLLDFGLAKLTETIQGCESTETLAMHTAQGVIVGSVAYMSPEQAEGRQVDERSDIFAFGSLLYEMLSGRRAFRGDTKLSILSAILHDEPAFSELPADTPRDLVRLISRCLRKDRERRLESLKDVRIALEELKQESDSGKLWPERQPMTARSSRTVSLIIAGVALLAAAAGFALWLGRSRGTPEPPVLTRVTFDAGLTTDPAISPDGRLLAYVSDRAGGNNLDLWVQQTAGGQPIRLTHGEADVREPSFSPDGTSIAFRWGRDGGGIYVVSSLGGQLRLIAARGKRPTFSPDGNTLAYWDGQYLYGGRLYVVPVAGGSPKAVQPGFFGASDPIWTPDGKHLLFDGVADGGAISETRDWWVAPVAGGEAVRTEFRKMSRGRFSPGPPMQWIPDRNAVLFSASGESRNNLWEAAISPVNWKTTAVRRLTSGTGLDVHPSVAGSGIVMFSSLTARYGIWGAPIDTGTGSVTGELRPLTQGASFEGIPSVSVDGQTLVFVSERSGRPQVWVSRGSTGQAMPLTTAGGVSYYPRLSPDGITVAYRVVEDGRPVLYTVPAEGGVPELKCTGCGAPADFSPDRRTLLYHLFDGNRSVGLLDLQSGAKTVLLQHPRNLIAQPHFSPDGRWIAFHSDIAAARTQIFITRFSGRPAAESDWIPVTDGATVDRDACWSPGGNLLYFISERDGFHCLWAQRLDPARKRPAGAPFAVLHLHSRRRSMSNVNINFLSIAVAHDRIVFPLGEITGDIWRAEWHER